jgi:RNA polymerase sigma-70 factor (ECF subfamily)
MANLKTPDAILVQSYIAGDEKAFEKLLKRHQSKVYSFIYAKIKDKDICEDIFQDSFIKVIKSLKSGKYNEQGKFLSWLICIANNTMMDYFNQTAKIPIIKNTNEYSPVNFIKDTNLSAQDILVNDGISVNLIMLVEKLPENQKIILKMRINDGLSFREISELTDTTINVVLGNMRYAIKNLKKLIKKHKIDLTEYNIL